MEKERNYDNDGLDPSEEYFRKKGKDNDDDTIENSPFIVIVPKEYFEDDNVDDYDVNSQLKVQIEDSRIKYMSKK